MIGAPLVLALPSHPAHGWAIGSQLDNAGCHEPITAQALRTVRATLDTAPALTPSRATSFGGRYRITERWIVGLDAGWNPWITTSPMKMRTGVVTVSGAVIRRFPMAFDRVNLRTSLHLGVSTLLFDVYGAPKYSTGPYVALSPLGVDYDLGHAVRIVWDPMEIALPVPLLGQLPLYYEQFRFMLGLQIGS